MKGKKADTTKSVKIFVESNDEILDVIDQVESADSNQVLLILPNHSLIGSSTVNLKLLSRKLLKLKKAVILITPSELITNKAHEASLIAKNKVEQVDPETWKEAFINQEELEDSIKANKAKLINERKEKPGSQKEPETKEREVETGPIAPKEIDTALEEIAPKQISEKPEHENQIKTSHVAAPPIKEMHNPKVVELKGFVFLPGGDIKSHPELYKLVSHKKETSKTQESAEPDIKKKLAPQPVAHEIIKETIPPEVLESVNVTPHSFHTEKSLVGHDITSHRNKKVRNFGVKTSIISAFLKKLFNKKLLILLVLLIPLLFFYRSRAESLEITLEVETKTIELAEEVTGNTDIKTVDITTKKIPINKVTKTKSMSDSDVTTGEGIVGEKATGVMDFFNKTQKEVVLPAGTTLVTINKNLTYFLNAEAKIPPAISDITPSKLESVPIIASEPGDNYNISDTDVKIAGYNPNTQLSGRIFRAVKGGTSEKVKMLTQADVDKLKASLTTTLTKLLEQEIDKSLGENDIKLPNSSTQKEIKFEITPQVGEEAEEFSIIALEYEMTVLTIDQNNLDNLADSMITEKYSLAEEGEIDAKQGATFENLQIGENSEVKFTIRKEAKTRADINESIIKAAIENKKLNEIGPELSDIKEIKDYDIKYSPAFLPSFLQRIPPDSSKVEINITSSD